MGSYGFTIGVDCSRHIGSRIDGSSQSLHFNPIRRSYRRIETKRILGGQVAEEWYVFHLAVLGLL